MNCMWLLLETLVSFWDVQGECFIIQGKGLKITLHDVYFLIGIPMLAVIDVLAPKLSHGDILEELYERHSYASSYVWGSYILMCDIEILSNRAIVVMVLWILGSSGNHKISGGQL